MNYAKYRYHVLCEDFAHFHFICGWLKQKGVNIRAKVNEPEYLPIRSSAKAFVRNTFDEYYQKVCAKAQTGNVALIIAIDVDDATTEIFGQQFTCKSGEPVFVLIPKWSIDTWARFLNNPAHENACDETKTCKPAYRKGTPWGKLGKQLADTPYTSIANLPSLKSTWDRIAKQKATLTEK